MAKAAKKVSHAVAIPETPAHVASTNQIADLTIELAESKKREAALVSLAAKMKEMSIACLGGGGRAAIKLTADVALGNGDRKAGTVLATIECEKGVEIAEVLNSLCNQQMIQMVAVEPL